MKKSTAWSEEIIGVYQEELILPNLIRLMAIKKGERILDLACGAGFFTREFPKKGAKVVGVDISPKLIAAAKRRSPGIEYIVARADQLGFLKDGSIDKIAMVLAVQNMDNLQAVFTECRRVLKRSGKLYLVMSHPAFRVPKASEWGWDEENKIQYRRVDQYLSESKAKIVMHPSTFRQTQPESYTITFHRPLQFYFKALNKAGFCVERLEEWNSHKKSESGPRAVAEDRARKEIPLFLFLEAVKP